MHVVRSVGRTATVAPDPEFASGRDVRRNCRRTSDVGRRMEFIAVDVETANPDLASVCQIGLVAFAAGTVRTRWGTLVDPEDFFDPINVSIHDIDERAVEGAPTFAEVFEAMANLAGGAILASHTSFDRVALRRAGEKYGLSELECTWLDTARVR